MTEVQLIKAASKNKRKAQSALYELYKRKWFSICLRYLKGSTDAEDALQNALVKIFSNIKTFDAERGSFNAWSSRIVVNECLMLLRGRVHSFKQVDINDQQHLEDLSESPLDRLSARELTALISALPTGYRAVFNLYVLDGYNHREIAEQLGISEGTSKSQLFKARRMLMEKLEVLI